MGGGGMKNAKKLLDNQSLSIHVSNDKLTLYVLSLSKALLEMYPEDGGTLEHEDEFFGVLCCLHDLASSLHEATVACSGMEPGTMSLLGSRHSTNGSDPGNGRDPGIAT